MKYTKLIFYGKFIDLSLLETDIVYLQPLSIVVRILVAFTCFIGLSGCLPFAILTDSYRSAKYQMIQLKKYWNL